MTTAAARASALLRDLDESRSLMTHAPHCTGGPLVTEQGDPLTVIRCQTCGAITTERKRS